MSQTHDGAKGKPKPDFCDHRRISKLLNQRTTFDKSEMKKVCKDVTEYLAKIDRDTDPLLSLMESNHIRMMWSFVFQPDKTWRCFGYTIRPTSRPYPKRIIPWTGFSRMQENIWERTRKSTAFHHSNPNFAQHSEMMFSGIATFSKPIDCAKEVLHFVWNSMNNYVDSMMREIHQDDILKKEFNFEKKVLIAPRRFAPSERTLYDILDTPELDNGRADRLWRLQTPEHHFVYEKCDDEYVPFVVIDYVVPYNLTLEVILAGSQHGEIQPERDVIKHDVNDFESLSRAYLTWVITVLFSDMIGAGVQRGYLVTGQALIFLHIPDDPSEVYYHVSIPSLEYNRQDKNRVLATHLAQVSNFIVDSLSLGPPGQSWHDAAASLDTWDAEGMNLLEKLDESSISDERRTAIFMASRFSGNSQATKNPEPRIPTKVQPKIHDRPYCTQQCLLSLAYGGPIDDKCPNSKDHGSEHLDHKKFLDLVRSQLATDRGRDAECTPMHRNGSRGVLYKVRLANYGYTFVAKAIAALNVKHLRHEQEIYEQLQKIQGVHVPVCLGMIDLDLPYYYDFGVYEAMLLQSWGGKSIYDFLEDEHVEGTVTEKIIQSLEALHECQVSQEDAALRNILWDPSQSRAMIIDFEHAEVVPEDAGSGLFESELAELRSKISKYIAGRKEDKARRARLKNRV